MNILWGKQAWSLEVRQKTSLVTIISQLLFTETVNNDIIWHTSLYKATLALTQVNGVSLICAGMVSGAHNNKYEFFSVSLMKCESS